MGNQSLITGAKYAAAGGDESGGFFNAGDSIANATKNIKSGSDNIANRIAAQKAKAKTINNKIGGYINKMKSDVDLTGISPEQQKQIQKFLIEEKSVYVEAANKIAGLDPNDPAYLEQADIMTSVNNSFQNLSNNLKVYKENQAEFVDDFKNNRLSNGDLVTKGEASIIYDPTTLFDIKAGELIFNADGKEINFRDFQNPAPKAFKTATSIMTMANTLYSNGQKMTPLKEQTIRLQLEEAFNINPNAARSLATDGFFDGQPMAIDPELMNNAEDAEAFQTEVINSLLKGLGTTAEDGYKEKLRKEGIAESKYRNRQNFNNNNKTGDNIGGRSVAERQSIADHASAFLHGKSHKGQESLTFNFKGKGDARMMEYTLSPLDENNFKYKTKGGVWMKLSKEELQKEIGITIN